jgi:hypothetical protein
LVTGAFTGALRDGFPVIISLYDPVITVAGAFCGTSSSDSESVSDAQPWLFFAFTVVIFFPFILSFFDLQKGGRIPEP